jgi:hypothetical protein
MISGIVPGYTILEGVTLLHYFRDTLYIISRGNIPDKYPAIRWKEPQLKKESVKQTCCSGDRGLPRLLGREISAPITSTMRRTFAFANL